MWKRVHKKLYPKINKDIVWTILTDIDNWHTWHGDLDYCKINGPFQVGNHFMLKPKGMKAVKIILTDIQDGHSFTDCTHFWGAKMYDTHTMEETKDGLLLTNTLMVTGPLRWLWIKLVAKNVADTVPQEMDALMKIAQKMAKTSSKNSA